MTSISAGWPWRKEGKKKWNKRVARVIDILRRLVNFDHLYIGGGNAKQIKFALPSDVTIVANSDGLTGGIALWRAEDTARDDGRGAPRAGCGDASPARAAPTRRPIEQRQRRIGWRRVAR